MITIVRGNKNKNTADMAKILILKAMQEGLEIYNKHIKEDRGFKHDRIMINWCW